MWAQPETPRSRWRLWGVRLPQSRSSSAVDLGLSIAPSVGGYDCTVWGAVMGRARLPILPADLAKAVDVARDELLKVVMWRDPAGKYAFQTGADIPEAGRDFALTTLARAGAALFRKLFWSPSAAADANKVGEFLRRMATETPKLKLQILADSAPIPWGMLYMGDASAGAKLDWRYFLGMSHVIEMIPLQNTLTVSASEIPTDRPKLAVSVNVNRGIDGQMGLDLVAQQESYWGGTHGFRQCPSRPPHDQGRTGKGVGLGKHR